MKRLALTMTLMVVFCTVGAFAASKKGTMKDPRDGKTYKTVKIGKQTWMAENLNYKTKDSYCYNDENFDFPAVIYDDKEFSCFKYGRLYGRLYTWNAALQACPTGWHLPSKKEFEVLLKAVGGTLGKEGDRWNGVAEKLKSTSGWFDDDGKSHNYDDAFGFSALPAGLRENGDYNLDRRSAFFWSSTEHLSIFAYFMRLYHCYDEAYLYNDDKNFGFSVRCLKD